MAESRAFCGTHWRGWIYPLVRVLLRPQNPCVLPCIERGISVNFRQQVFFTEDVFRVGNLLLRNVLSPKTAKGRPRVLLFLDEGVARAQPRLVPNIEQWFKFHGETVDLVAPPYLIEGGERVKNAYFHVSQVHERIHRHNIDRHNYVIVVGGGAMLDMVGLAAATAHRGVRLIRVPTTTLAQADSGVGVKNGINAFDQKNFIGTFVPPFAVINDFEFLRSLSDRDKRGGLAEAVKVACIRDAAFFAYLEEHVEALARFEESAMKPVIYRSAELHLDHIATGGDPFEFGSARPLDFGHWSAHKLELLSDYRIRHGDAVAIGMALDVLYSRNVGMLDAGSAERIVRLLERQGFELYAPELHYADSNQSFVLLQGLEDFRQHLGGELTITLLEGIGRGVEIHSIQHDHVLSAMNELRSRASRASSADE